MNDNVFVDTNVFVYMRDSSKADKQYQAFEWITYLWRTGTGRVSMQVITEYYTVVTAKLKPGLDIHSAREDVIDLYSWQPISLTQELISEGWLIQDLFQISWWDSLIIAAARFQQCAFLLSEDFQHLQDFQGMKVINPFLVSPTTLPRE